MNFSVSGGGVGWLGVWVLFGAAMIAFALVMVLIRRAAGGKDVADGAERNRDDDFIL